MVVVRRRGRLCGGRPRRLFSRTRPAAGRSKARHVAGKPQAVSACSRSGSEDTFRRFGEKLVPILEGLDVARAGTHAFVAAWPRPSKLDATYAPPVAALIERRRAATCGYRRPHARPGCPLRGEIVMSQTRKRNPMRDSTERRQTPTDVGDGSPLMGSRRPVVVRPDERERLEAQVPRVLCSSRVLG